MNCGDRESNRSLKTGSHPKECTKPGEDDESCLLQDDSYSECACGIMGSLIAALHSAIPRLMSTGGSVISMIMW
jgi:hypothetical protein